MVLEKKKVYSSPMIGLATVNRMHSNGLKRLTNNAAAKTVIRITGAEFAMTSGRKVFSAQFAARFSRIAVATAITRKNTQPTKERPFGSKKISR